MHFGSHFDASCTLLPAGNLVWFNILLHAYLLYPWSRSLSKSHIVIFSLSAEQILLKPYLYRGNVGFIVFGSYCILKPEKLMTESWYCINTWQSSNLHQVLCRETFLIHMCKEFLKITLFCFYIIYCPTLKETEEVFANLNLMKILS